MRQLSPTNAPLAPMIAGALLALFVAPPASGQDVMLRAFASPGINRMSDWSAGMTVLRDRAREQDRDLGFTWDPGLGFAWGVGGLWGLGAGRAVGLEAEWLRDQKELLVEDRVMTHFYDIYGALATSRVVRIVGRYTPWPEEPLALEASTGYGWGELDWRGDLVSARGKGGGPYLGAAVVLQRPRRRLGFAVTLGARWHPVSLDYRDSEMRQPSQFCIENPGDPGCTPSLFSGTADLEAFLDGRDADFTGIYLRLDLTVSPRGGADAGR